MAAAFEFLANAGSFARRRKREPLGSRKTGFDTEGFSGSLPAARIWADLRDTAEHELERLPARAGMRSRTLRSQS